MRQAIYLCYLGLVISKVLLLLQSVIFPEFFMLLKSCISVFASERQLFQQVCTGSLWKTITFLSIARDFENFSEKKKKNNLWIYKIHIACVFLGGALRFYVISQPCEASPAVALFCLLSLGSEEYALSHSCCIGWLYLCDQYLSAKIHIMRVCRWSPWSMGQVYRKLGPPREWGESTKQSLPVGSRWTIYLWSDQ